MLLVAVGGEVAVSLSLGGDIGEVELLLLLLQYEASVPHHP